jgi:hypothetical protein
MGLIVLEGRIAVASFGRMMKKALLHPPLPQARQDALLPELRSRLATILNAPRGIRTFWLRLRSCWTTFLIILVRSSDGPLQ